MRKESTHAMTPRRRTVHESAGMPFIARDTRSIPPNLTSTRLDPRISNVRRLANREPVETCLNSQVCAFFKTETGYSPELNSFMRAHFCGGNPVKCARFRAGESIGHENVPDDMLPTDEATLAALTRD